MSKSYTQFLLFIITPLNLDSPLNLFCAPIPEKAGMRRDEMKTEFTGIKGRWRSAPQCRG